MAEREKRVVGDYTLEYDDSTHSYWVDGRKCISVTQLLKHKFPKKYDGIDDYILKLAAEKGILVHESIEVFERFGIDSIEMQEFRDYLFLKRKFSFEIMSNEVPIIIKYKDMFVCGRLDLVIKEKGLIGLGDIKCTSILDKEYLAYQLNLYRIGFRQSFNMDAQFLRGLHLKNGKRKYIEIPVNEELAIQLLEEYWKKEKENES